jgi:hypothetical protein
MTHRRLPLLADAPMPSGIAKMAAPPTEQEANQRLTEKPLQNLF